MKVVVINGSPRNNGFTATILHTMERELLQMGAEVEYVDLSRLKMSQCLGCCSCYRSGFCCIKDDAELLSGKILAADALILGSPTYASNVSGLMKLFIDRGHFVIEQLLKDKYCVVVATGENYGKNDTAKVLKKLVLYSGGSLVRTIAVNAPFDSVRSTGEACTTKNANTAGVTGTNKDINTVGDPNTSATYSAENTAKAAAAKLFRAVSGQRRYPFQSLYHKIIFNVGIKPFVLRKGEAYRGVTERWRAAGILLGR